MHKLLFFILILISCSRLGAQDCFVSGQNHYNFADIKAILDKNNCISCHNSGGGLWQYSTYDSFLTSLSCDQEMIRHGNAAESYFFNILYDTNIDCVQTVSEHSVSKEELSLIENWINIGAPEKCIPLHSEIHDVLDNNGCNSCHNNNNPSTVFQYEDYQNLANSQGNCGPIITNYQAQQSSLYAVASNSSDCQHEASTLSEDEVIAIKDWINAGSPADQTSLPVELLFFSIENVNDEYVYVNWATGSEIGTEAFILERSMNGREFEKIATITATNEAGGKYNYQDYDLSPGILYYRLKILDLDSRHEYSAIKHTKLSQNEFFFQLQPNPISSGEEVMITWYSQDLDQESAKIQLVDSSGRRIAAYRIKAGQNSFRVPKLNPGVYYFYVMDYQDNVHFERIIVFE